MITAVDQARRKGLVPVYRELNMGEENYMQEGKRRNELSLYTLHKREADRSRKPIKQRQGKAGVKTIFSFYHAAKSRRDKRCKRQRLTGNNWDTLGQFAVLEKL